MNRTWDAGREVDETICDKCGATDTSVREYDDLSGNGETHCLCSDCADEMYDAWDEERQEPIR